jgi:prepilin-type processing-associated H-X9-DG protein
MKVLGNSFEVCSMKAFDENKDFIIPQNWCDYLICNTDIGLSSFYCFDSDAREGESGYALNKHLLRKKYEDIPIDVVLLFESDLGKDSKKIRMQEREFYSMLSDEDKQYFKANVQVHKDQWNQIGDWNDIFINRHLEKGSNILYTDGHVEFVEANKIPNLRWTVEEAGTE